MSRRLDKWSPIRPLLKKISIKITKLFLVNKGEGCASDAYKGLNPKFRKNRFDNFGKNNLKIPKIIINWGRATLPRPLNPIFRIIGRKISKQNRFEKTVEQGGMVREEPL